MSLNKLIHNRAFLWVEFLLIYLGVPYLFISGLVNIPFIPVLLVFGFIFLFAMKFDKTFDQIHLGNIPAFVRSLTSIIPLFIVGAGLLTVLAYFLYQDTFFLFPLERTGIWIAVMILYPIFSVVPQGIIYRAYYVHRFGSLFTSVWTRRLLGALLFGYGHLLFYNWAAFLLSIVGGYLFLWRYESSKSLLASHFEHALYGMFIFTVGIGVDFYTGG